MKTTALLFSSVIMLAGTNASHAQNQHIGGEISFSDKTAKLNAYYEKYQPNLNTRIGASFFYTTDKNRIATVYGSAMRPHLRQFYPLSIGVVPTLAYIHHNLAGMDENGMSLMLGVKGALHLNPGLPTVFSATYAYGPEIFSSGDVKNVKTFSLKGGIEMAPSVSLFLEYGYTNVDFSKTGNDHTLDNTVRAGISFAL